MASVALAMLFPPSHFWNFNWPTHAHALNTRMVAILIGERPGLSVSDSLGIYLTLGPFPERLESERNCISNIHSEGLSHAEAGAKLGWLAREARRRGVTGIGLKDEAPLYIEAPSTQNTQPNRLEQTKPE